MKISNVSSIFKLSNNNGVISSHNNLNRLNCDTFEKSVSFGNSFDDIENVISSSVSNLEETLDRFRNETIINGFINILLKTKINPALKTPYKAIWQNVLLQPSIDLIRTKGIKSPSELRTYVDSLSSPKVKAEFHDKAYHHVGIDIFGTLDDKSDFEKFPDLLLYMYNLHKESNPDKEFNPNETLNFIKKIGIKETDDTGKKFKYLAAKYNNYEDISDIYNAINDLKQEYPNVIKYAEDLKTQFPDILKEDISRYSNQTNYNILNYLYLHKGDKSYSNNNQKIAEFLANFNKIPQKQIKQLSEAGDLSDPEKLINFMNFLADNNVSADEFLSLSAKSYISDNNLYENIVNKNTITKQIANIKGIDEKSSAQIYINYADEYNAIYKQAQQQDSLPEIFGSLLDRENVIETFTNTIDKYSEGNNKKFDFKEIHALFTGSKPNAVDSKTFTEIIGLMQLFDSKQEITNYKKEQVQQTNKDKKTPKKFQKKPETLFKNAIKQEQENFNKVKDQIIDYINKDNSGFYRGKTPLEIYKAYRNELSCEGINIKNILDSHKNGSSVDIELYQSFATLIEDKDELNRFIKNKKINLDKTTGNKKYNENCFKILSLLSKDKSTQTELEYFIKSTFLNASKTDLDNFFIMHSEPEEQVQILTAIAKSQIASLQEFNIFVTKYSDKNNASENVLTALCNLPEGMNCKTYDRNFLEPLNSKIEEYKLPYKIDNSNILNIPTQKIKKLSSCSQNEILELINYVADADSRKNIISKLPELYIEKSVRRLVNKTQIANEYLKYWNGTDESYDNMCSLFGLEPEYLGLSTDYSYSMLEESVKQKIPQEFVKLLNESFWTQKSDDSSQVINLPLHAKMRFIDRFILPDIKKPDELYSKETKLKMKKLLDEIYKNVQSVPHEDIELIDRTRHSQKEYLLKLSTTCNNGEKVTTIFSTNGNLITLYPPYSSNVA